MQKEQTDMLFSRNLLGFLEPLMSAILLEDEIIPVAVALLQNYLLRAIAV